MIGSSVAVTAKWKDQRARLHDTAVRRIRATGSLQNDAASAGPVLFSSLDTITISDGVAATPYPSTNQYTWCSGTVTDVNVYLYGLTHTRPDDIDIVLQGPTGQSTILMSDVGGDADADFLFLGFDDESPTAMPDSTVLTDELYAPTDSDSTGGDSDTMPAPAPSPATAALSVFDGTDPTGTWSLYVRDDAAGDSGEIAEGWDLELEVTAATSGTRVCVPHIGPGEPYPSQQSVDGLHPVTDVNVKLNGLSHTWPDDLDLLLQGPSGQSAMLMSDAGGGFPLSNVSLTIDDEAAGSFPSDGPIGSGSYRPTDHDAFDEDAGDDLPPPAPVPSGTALSVFDGTNPNGTWKLFVHDPVEADQGILSGWSLEVETGPPAMKVSKAKVTEGKAVRFRITPIDQPTLPITVSFKTKNGSAKKGRDYKKRSGTLTFAVGDGPKMVKVKTTNDGQAERSERFFLISTSGSVTAKGTARILDND